MKTVLFLLFLLLLLLSAQNNTVDSLKLALKNSKHDTSKVKTLYYWGKLISFNNPDSAHELFKSGLALIKKSEKKYLKNSLESRSFNKSKARLLDNLGSYYQAKGNITLALEYFQQSLKIYEDLKSRSGIAKVYISIGGLYYDQLDNDKAKQFWEIGLKVFQELNDLSGQATSLSNLGALHTKIRNLDKAESLHNQALNLYQKLGLEHGVAYCYNNLGGLNVKRGNISKALEYYKQSLLLQQKAADKRGTALASENICEILLSQKKYSEAQQYAESSMKIGKEIGFPLLIMHAALSLSKINKLQNNPTKALEYYELHIQMRDSVNNEANKKASIKSQLKYEYEKRAAADSVKNAEEQKVKDAQLKAQSASLKQEKTQRFALYSGLCLVILFALFMVNRFRVTNKQKKIIEEQKALVDLSFAKLEEKNNEILDSIHYAKRIQNALMPNEKYIERILNKLN